MKTVKGKVNIRYKAYLAYEVFMAALALVVLYILFVDFTRPITEEQRVMFYRIDMAILIIFAVDYFYRLFRAKNKWVFIKSNFFDLIAIIPFDQAFRLARIFRLIRFIRFAKLARLTRLIRPIVILKRAGVTLSDVAQTNGLLYVLIFTLCVIIVGSFGIMIFEDSMGSFFDAFWWSLVTITTVGYGDIAPSSNGGRLIASILMLVGIGTLGMLTGSIATYFIKKPETNESPDKGCYMNEQIELVVAHIKNIENLSSEEVNLINKTIVNVWEECSKKGGSSNDK